LGPGSSIGKIRIILKAPILRVGNAASIRGQDVSCSAGLPAASRARNRAADVLRHAFEAALQGADGLVPIPIDGPPMLMDEALVCLREGSQGKLARAIRAVLSRQGAGLAGLRGEGGPRTGGRLRACCRRKPPAASLHVRRGPAQRDLASRVHFALRPARRIATFAGSKPLGRRRVRGRPPARRRPGAARSSRNAHGGSASAQKLLKMRPAAIGARGAALAARPRRC